MGTIVVGYVPKPEGRAALRRAAEEAKLRDMRLVVVNSHRGGREFDRDDAIESEQQLDEVRATLQEAGVEHEVRQLVRTLQPALVVLDANLDEESGWLICAKLRREQPRLRVVLTTRRPTAADRRFARFVGARGLIDPCNRLRLSAPPVC